jgi:hypothetical protein
MPVPLETAVLNVLQSGACLTVRDIARELEIAGQLPEVDRLSSATYQQIYRVLDRLPVRTFDGTEAVEIVRAKRVRKYALAEVG